MWTPPEGDAKQSDSGQVGDDDGKVQRGQAHVAGVAMIGAHAGGVKRGPCLSSTGTLACAVLYVASARLAGATMIAKPAQPGVAVLLNPFRNLPAGKEVPWITP